ncbi:hypothetical protein B0H13DRAFT_2463676 [Mycena leptocephala]|nr:hypothetical protein B0H13DRAFT_2463676 [Mycena leptocephala]
MASPLPTHSPAALRTRLADLDAEMDALELRLRSLASERRRVVLSLKSIIYPVLTLSSEITSRIFSHYVNEPHVGRTRTPGRGPLTLASVCRSWRDLCISVRSLWASLRIYPDSSWVIEEFLRFLQCWIQRAGNHPLDLHVFRSEPGTTTMDILSFLAPYSVQLHTLGFTLDKPFSFPNAQFQKKLPLLEKLVVNVITESDHPVIMTAFSDAPRLRQVRLSGASRQWISLPWIQLTHLEFSDESVPSCLQILQETSNLEILDVYLPGWESNSLRPPPLTLPHLHTLRFRYDHDGILLDRLVLPSLKTIQLTSLRDEGVSRLFSLGVRSAWSLRSIHLKSMAAHILYLRSLSSLEEVEIQYSWEWSSDALLDELDELIKLLHDDSTFLPALRALTLRECGSDIPVSSLAEMLASRWNGDHDGVAKLESFRLFFSREAVSDSQASVDEIAERLRPLIDAGLDGVIGSSHA